MKLTAEEIREAYNCADEDTDIVRLLKMPACPDDVLAEDLSRNIALTITTTPRIMRFDAYARIRVAGRHPNLSAETISKYVDWGKENRSNLHKISDILGNTNMTVTHFESLLTREYAAGTVLMFIAGNPSCPTSLVEQAANSISNARVAAASNPCLDPQLMARLLNDSDWTVRTSLIRNKSVPLDMLQTIIHDPSYGRYYGRHSGSVRVFQALVRRFPAGPDRQKALEILVSFNSGQASKVLMAKLTNEVEVAHEYCFDDDPVVRAAASKNPATPEEGRVAVALLDPQAFSV